MAYDNRSDDRGQRSDDRRNSDGHHKRGGSGGKKREYKGNNRGSSGKRQSDDRTGKRDYQRDDRGERRSYNRSDKPSYGRKDSGERRDSGRNSSGNKRGDRRSSSYDRPESEEKRFAGQRRSDNDNRRQNQRDDFRKPRKDKPHQAEYRSPDPDEPTIPAGVVADELGEDVLRALETLAGANREIVARHLVMAGQLLEVDADQAYQHAQAAVKRAGRVDVVREAAALTAYATGRYEEALREVRAVRRMRGDESLRAIEADCERGLGRLEKALAVVQAADTSKMSLEEQVELILVAAGIRHDMEQTELGLLIIEDALGKLPELADNEPRARLMSYQADLLRALGREEEADAVESAIPVEEEVMEITDLGELLDADVDHTRTPLRGSDKALVEIYDAAVLDLDGVCFEGKNPIPHASEALNEAANEGLKLAYATNNASRSAEEIAEKLRGFNIPVDPDHVRTAAMEGVQLLQDEVEPGSTVLVVGTESLANLVTTAGFTVVREATGPVDAVIQGYGPEVGWAELSEAAYAINNGARYYATNLDTTLPTERGLALGNGSLVSAVIRATGKRPAATGKPNPEIMVRAAATVEGERPLGVGDRLGTDTAAAIAARMPALHVLTGVSSAADVVGAKRGERPSYLALDLRGLLEPHPQPKHHRDGTWTAGVSQPVKFTRWGHMVVDDVELRPDGDPVKINLDTYRALAAAGWELLDNDRSVRVPKLIVVDNDDLEGIIDKPNYEIPAEEEADETQEGGEASETVAEVEEVAAPQTDVIAEAEEIVEEAAEGEADSDDGIEE